MYYPTAIADDESLESNCSNTIEGAYCAAMQPQHLQNNPESSRTKTRHPWEKRDVDYGLAEEEEFEDVPNRRCETKFSKEHGSKDAISASQKEDLAALIRNERNRRLGVTATAGKVAASENVDRIEENAPSNNSNNDRAHSQSSGGLLGNIKGWFGGGNHEASERSLSNSTRSINERAERPASTNRTHSDEPHQHQPNLRASYNRKHSDESLEPSHQPNLRNGDLRSAIEEESDDSATSSSSSAATSQSSPSHHSLDRRTRARHRALRYLSNSCVDAGRKSKTLSYIWGLERLDLKRRRDRYERELGVVEGEMNKDWGSGDAVAELAERLARELPRIAAGGSGGGADAGAGSEREGARSGGKGGCVMSLDEYVEAVQRFDPVYAERDEENHPSNLLWSDEEALEKYSSYLRSRLREAMERTKSLEKRLAVLEKTGDEIVASLCEDLVDVTSHSNKAEARYVKKGKELERKRRREEMRFRTKIKELERRVNLLEDGILTGQSNSGDKGWDVNAETSDSDDDEGDEENDEIRLEKKLSSIKARSEQEKAEHEQAAQSIRRQCEQSKLRLSVARLVMSGDDNLREYISVLEKFNPSTQHQQRRRSQFGESCYDDDYDGMPTEVLPPPPPPKVTRGRAKLLKAMHLERIYEQRLAVSKAFNDAAINALEHELADREEAGEKMEVRCLNELMVIDSEIKEIVSSGEKKVAELQKEVRELEDAMEVVSSDVMSKSRDDANQLAIVEYKPESTDSTDNDSTSEDSSSDAKRVGRDLDVSKYSEANCSSTINPDDFLDISKKSESSALVLYHHNGTPVHEEHIRIDVSEQSEMGAILRYDHGNSLVDDVSKQSENSALAQFDPDDSSNKHTSEYEKESIGENDSQESDQERSLSREDYLGDVTPNTPNASNDKAGDETPVHMNCSPKADNVEVLSTEGIISDSASQKQTEAKKAIPTLPDNKTSRLTTEQREKVLRILGQELKCTLAEYQTSFDISTSNDRVEQLDYMNTVALKIAEVAGIELRKSENEDGCVKSWSLTKSEKARSLKDKKDRSKKKRSKKHSSVKKRKSRKEKEKNDGLSKKDRSFLASLSSAKFS